jgi:xanthine dehydrogenase YagS FAD-binding subunit
VRDVRIALGGVATKPWRAHEAEVALRGQPLDERSMAAAAAAAVEGATPRPDNTFKVELARRTLRGTLSMLGELV